MTFTTVSGIEGKIFVPSRNTDFPKKNPCENCYACQMCSDDRCSVCLCQNGTINEPVPARNIHREGCGRRRYMLKSGR